MSTDITIRVPDDLGRQLEAYRDRLPELLARGLRDVQLEGTPALAEVADIVSALSTEHAPEIVLTLHPSEALQHRMSELLAQSKHDGLTPAEDRELDRYLYLEHLVRLAKARALEQTTPAG